MDFIKLTCPNCNGKIVYKDEQIFKCPYCETELLLKQNNVTINNYYGSSPVHTKAPVRTTTQPSTNLKMLYIVPIILICSMVAYFFLTNNPLESSSNTKGVSTRTMPESEVLQFFLKDIFNKGAAMPTEEEIASIRYLSTRFENDQWHFAYSFDDPFTNEQAEISNYVIMDKILNKQKIEQKDFESFSGLTVLKLNNEYQVSQGQKVSFRHLQDLKSYTGAFNESFGEIAHYFGDKAKIVELSTQIRSNAQMALLLEFPNLQSLEISYVDESVTDFHILNQLKLKSLSFRSINDLKWVSSLVGLESLAIEYSDATDFSALYSLTQLQALRLTYVRNLKTLDFLQNMPNLQSLDLEYVDITNLDRLRNKSSLTKLRLASLYKVESIEVVNSLTSLSELVITGYNGDASPIVAPNLKKAEIKESFIPKLKAPALKSLTVYMHGPNNYLDGAELVKYPKLEQLTTMESGYFIGIRSLNRLPSLQTLRLNETDCYDETNELFNLQHVKTINCNECRFQINSQNPFANNTLEHLTLNKTYFRIGKGDWLKEMDKVMPYFVNFTALRSFKMQDSSLQDLQFMKNWQQIEVLHLENNAISSVEPLVDLPKLQKLYILGNQVQNESVLNKGTLIY